ncbi:TPA: hypothetical protein ACH3X1_007303 [Trebouxia sp. C0004]
MQQIQSMATSNCPSVLLVQDGGSRWRGMIQECVLLQSWTGLKLPCCHHLTLHKAPPHASSLPVPPKPSLLWRILLLPCPFLPTLSLQLLTSSLSFYYFVPKCPQASLSVDPSLDIPFAC